MLAEIIPLVAAPLLVGLATLVATRYGQQLGGLVSAFPAIVGPVLLIDTEAHGRAFAARAATGTLFGLLTLAGFVFVYARVAPRYRWGIALLCGWAAAGAITAGLGLLNVARAGPLVATLAALVALELVRRSLPRPATPRLPALPAWEIPVRMVLTLLLVLGLSAAAGVVGSELGGILAALPVLASILAAFTHRHHGADALLEMLRGMLNGMAAFVLFCAAVAFLLQPVGVWAFAIAALAAAGMQAVQATRLRVRSPWPEARQAV